MVLEARCPRGLEPKGDVMKRSALVERDFKLRFGLKLCLLIVVGMFALTAVLYLVTTKTLGASYGSAIYAIYALRISSQLYLLVIKPRW